MVLEQCCCGGPATGIENIINNNILMASAKRLTSSRGWPLLYRIHYAHCIMKIGRTLGGEEGCEVFPGFASNRIGCWFLECLWTMPCTAGSRSLKRASRYLHTSCRVPSSMVLYPQWIVPDASQEYSAALLPCLNPSLKRTRSCGGANYECHSLKPKESGSKNSTFWNCRV